MAWVSFGQISHRNVKISAGNKSSASTYLSRKSLSTTAEMSSKGFPIPKSMFSLWEDKKHIVLCRLPLTRRNKQSAVIETIICFWFPGLNQWSLDERWSHVSLMAVLPLLSIVNMCTTQENKQQQHVQLKNYELVTDSCTYFYDFGRDHSSACTEKLQVIVSFFSLFSWRLELKTGNLAHWEDQNKGLPFSEQPFSEQHIYKQLVCHP